MIDPAQLAREYQEGASLRDLAKRYPWSHATIGTMLKAAGVELRRTWGKFKPCPVCGRPFRARKDRIHCSSRCRRKRAAAGQTEVEL